MQDVKFVTTSSAAAVIADVSGRPCGPENVRRLAKAGQLEVATVVGNGQRLFDRNAVVRFALRRGQHGNGDEAA